MIDVGAFIIGIGLWGILYSSCNYNQEPTSMVLVNYLGPYIRVGFPGFWAQCFLILKRRTLQPKSRIVIQCFDQYPKPKTLKVKHAEILKSTTL